MLPLWLTIPDVLDEKRKHQYPLTFLLSLVWIVCLAYNLVWFATIIAETFGSSVAILGLLCLGPGTSLSTLITTVFLAKDAKGDGNLSASIGSNVFNMTVSLSLPWLLYNLIHGNAVEIHSAEILGSAIVMLLIALFLMFSFLIFFKGELTKILGGFMLLLFAMFFIFSVTLSTCTLVSPF